MSDHEYATDDPPEGATRTPITFYSAAEFVDVELPPPDQILEDFADRGDKAWIIGGSKGFKSANALQIGMHMASGGKAGMPFTVKQPHRVLFLNLEIKGGHFRRRIQRMARRLGLSHEIGNLLVADLRGVKIEPADIVDMVREAKAEVVIVDPAYKLAQWDEVDATEWLAGFDAIVEATNALLIVVHHEKKGLAGDRQGVDRGSGDGRIQRDYDAALLLAPQRDEDNAVVYSQIQRNYAPAAPVVMRYDCGAFIEAPDLPAIEATSRTARARSGRVSITLDQVEALVREFGPLSAMHLKMKLRDAGATKDVSESLIQEVVTAPGIDVYVRQERKAGGRKLYATKAQIAALEAEGKA
jgi:RecA-family ATPase